MWRRDTHDRSSGLYPSESTKYCQPWPRRKTSRILRTVYAGAPPMIHTGGGRRWVVIGPTQVTGLTRETWNVGCTFIDVGSLSLTAAGLTIRSTLNGPTNRGTSFLQSTWSGRSLEDSQTRPEMVRPLLSLERGTEKGRTYLTPATPATTEVNLD